MQNKKFVIESFSTLIGKQGENLASILEDKKYVNEFIIAKKLNLTINQVRNLLYRLSDFGLISSQKKKDKRKGWFTYFWKIEKIKTLEFYKNEINKKIYNLEHQIKSREIKRFYICERCKIELAEENALLYDFKCQECGSIFSLKDNIKLISELKKNLDFLKNNLLAIEEEIKKELEMKYQKIEKDFKKEKKIKKIKRKLQKSKLKKSKKKKKK